MFQAVRLSASSSPTGLRAASCSTQRSCRGGGRRGGASSPSSHPSDSFRVLLLHRLSSPFFFSPSLADLVCWVPAPATASWVRKTVSRRRCPLRWTPESSSDTSRPRASRPGSCSRWQSTEGELSCWLAHSLTHSFSHMLTPPGSSVHS